MNTLDKLLRYVTPRRALARTRARHALDALRAYDAASHSRRTEGWRSPATSANTEIGPALSTLRDRSRELVRNNPYAQRAVNAFSANIIGSGIVPQAKTTKKRLARTVQAAWQAWATTLHCDLDSQHNLYGLQQVAVRAMVESGECLIRRVKGRYPGCPLPLRCQVLESDFLDTARNSLGRLANGHYIVQGIEFNAQHERVAYWLFDEHPGGVITNAVGEYVSHRVDASEVIHLYRVDRPGQVRGVPWGTPVMLKLKDLDDFDHAELVRHKIAACFVGFIRDTEWADQAPSSPVISDKFEPGLIEGLPAGKDITFSNPPAVQGYSEYVTANLRAVAVGFGLPYEVLSSDYSQVNFSSARMGWLEFQRHLHQWQTQLIIPRLCHRLWAWFTEALTIQGVAGANTVQATWTPPRREMIDPTKEVKALRDQVRSGFMSLSETLRALGYDPQQQLDELAQDAERLDDLHLILDCDPRHTSQSGGLQKGDPTTTDEEVTTHENIPLPKTT